MTVLSARVADAERPHADTIPTARVQESVGRVILGKAETIRLALCGLLAGGHVLIEDRPGVGKTTLAKALAASLGCTFKRIQFTPDLLPADVTGTSIFNQKTGEFDFRPGPIFANILLADEINRTTPKTQSSLLEAMEEFQVTIDGVSYPLPAPFFVVATQNALEYQGTYPLPEAQLDRFLLRIDVGYPTREEETEILASQMDHHPLRDVTPVLEPDQILNLQRQVRHVHVDPAVQRYIVDIAANTRRHPAVSVGASPRASLGLLQAARSWALLDGRTYCLPDDVKRLAIPVLSHRMLLDGSHRGMSEAAIIEETLLSTPVPVLD
ncbi:MAG TPA: MoxR family ATPase [Armatimonadota bacterium]|nr:MoxR family ATPase [Armatimonadota bacterium]